jgi:major inositol transporter-like SP family MFS transporter
MYYGTSILEKAGFGTQVALVANIGNGLMSVTAALVYMRFFANRFGRRTLLLVGLTGTTITMLLMTITTNVLAGSPILPYVVLTLTIIFLAFFQGCLGPIAWLLLAEIFPLRIRGLGMGISVFFLWITNFFIGLLFPTMLSNLGLSGSFSVFVVLGVLGWTFVYKCVPETLGKSLEELEKHFKSYKSKNQKTETITK